MEAFCGTYSAESPELMVTYLGVKALPPPPPPQDLIKNPPMLITM